VLLARAKGHVVSRGVWMPRLAATVLFLVLLVTTAWDDKALWIHLSAVAVPYLASLSLARGAQAG
jgi:hypothetical protein